MREAPGRQPRRGTGDRRSRAARGSGRRSQLRPPLRGGPPPPARAGREVLGRPRLASVSLVFADHADPTRVRSRGCTTRRWGAGGCRATASTTWTCCSSCSETWRRSVTAEDAFGILLPLRGGGLAVVSFTATARHDRGDLIEIYGAEGTVRLDPDGRLSWRRSERSCRSRDRWAPRRRRPSSMSPGGSGPPSAAAPRPIPRSTRRCACRASSTQCARPTSSGWVQPEPVVAAG